MSKLTKQEFYPLNQVPKAFQNEKGKALSLSQYAVKRNCNMSAVQTHIKTGKLTEGVSYVKHGNDSEKPRYAFDFDAAQNEWEQNVKSLVDRVDKNFNKPPRVRHKKNETTSSPKTQKITRPKNTGEFKLSDLPGFEDFPDEVSGGELYKMSKGAGEFYKTQTIKFKLDEEKKDLIRLEDVKFVLSNFFVEIKQRHLALNSRLKALIGKEASNLVKEEIEIMLTELSKTGVNLR